MTGRRREAPAAGAPKTTVELLRFANHLGEIGYTWPDRFNPIVDRVDAYPMIVKALADGLIKFDREMPAVSGRDSGGMPHLPRRSIYKLTRRGEAILTADDPTWRTKALVRYTNEADCLADRKG